MRNWTRNTLRRSQTVLKRIPPLLLSLVLVLVTVVAASIATPTPTSAAIAQRGTATTGTTTNTSLTIDKPTGVVSGDVMLVSIAQVGNNSVDPASNGWTVVAGASLSGKPKSRGAVLYRVADGTEEASFAFTLGRRTTGAVGSIVAFSGVDTSGATPFDVIPEAILAGSGTNVGATAITTASANAAVIMFGMAANGAPTWSGWTTTSPGALTELYDSQNSSGASVGAAWAAKATAGDTGAGTATLSAAQQNGGILIALKPTGNPVPATTSISPTAKAVGDADFTLTVDGANFIGTSVVRVDGADRATTYVSSTQLTAIIPASDLAAAVSRSITVFNPTPGGGTSNGQTLTVSASTPSVTSLSPSLGRQGQTLPVVITGVNLTGATSVSFGAGVTVTAYTVDSATRMSANIGVDESATIGTRDLSVTTPGGTATKAGAFSVAPPLAVPAAWSATTYSTRYLYSVWGSSTLDVFAVGNGGVILHFDGSSLNAMTSGTTTYLRGVWGSSATDVFVVGIGGTIQHYDGTAWSAMDSGTTNDLHAVWGTSASDVFAVGVCGTILHYDGTAWSPMTSGTTNWLRAVWGTSASDVFAVGYTGTILRYDGSAWSSMTSGTTRNLLGIWGSSASDVFVVGASGSILHYNGSAWGVMTSGTTSTLNGVWGTSGSDVFVVGYTGTIRHYNGSAWGAMTSGTTNTLLGIWGYSSTEVVAVGYSGSILYYHQYEAPAVSGTNPSQGSQGTTMNVGITGANFAGATSVSLGSGITVNGFTVNSITQITANVSIDGSATVGTRDVSVTTPGGSALKTGAFTVCLPVAPAWSAMTSGGTAHLYSIWGSSASNVFAVGDNGTILRYNGSTWSAMTSGTTRYLRGIWGSSASDVFAVGTGGTILYYDGAAWGTMTSGTTNYLYGIWGTSASDVFAVGDSGTILHYDGSAWSPMTSGTTNLLLAVWGTSGSDVFAVGDYGVVLHYDGSTWSAMTSGTTRKLCGVWGSSGSNVFAVGTSGVALHYDGSSWSAMASGTGYTLYAIWGSSGSDIYAVGNLGVIRHYDGSSWGAVTSGTTNILLSIWGTSSANAFTSGRSGTILRHHEYPAPAISGVDPGQGSRGSTLNVTITGANLTGATSVSFGSGIMVNSFIVSGDTQITVNITIDGSATVGPRDVSVTTPGGTATGGGAFTVIS
jgi:hypothetical protein